MSIQKMLFEEWIYGSNSLPPASEKARVYFFNLCCTDSHRQHLTFKFIIVVALCYRLEACDLESNEASALVSRDY